MRVAAVATLLGAQVRNQTYPGWCPQISIGTPNGTDLGGVGVIFLNGTPVGQSGKSLLTLIQRINYDLLQLRNGFYIYEDYSWENVGFYFDLIVTIL
jgi:hypothetical protein